MRNIKTLVVLFYLGSTTLTAASRSKEVPLQIIGPHITHLSKGKFYSSHKVNSFSALQNSRRLTFRGIFNEKQVSYNGTVTK